MMQKLYGTMKNVGFKETTELSKSRNTRTGHRLSMCRCKRIQDLECQSLANPRHLLKDMFLLFSLVIYLSPESQILRSRSVKYMRRMPIANPRKVPLEGYAFLRSSTTTKSRAPPATEKKSAPNRSE